MHRDSLKTIKNQIDVLFAEKRRLERIEKGEGEPQKKKIRDSNTPNFSGSPRERESVLRTGEKDERPGQKLSSRDRVADDAREGGADVSQGKSGRGFRGRARGRGRGRGRGRVRARDVG